MSEADLEKELQQVETAKHQQGSTMSANSSKQKKGLKGLLPASVPGGGAALEGFLDVYSVQCYECREEGALVTCAHCERNFHVECSGDDKVLRRKHGDPWACRVCADVSSIVEAQDSEDPCGQRFEASLMKLHDTVDRFTSPNIPRAPSSDRS